MCCPPTKWVCGCVGVGGGGEGVGGGGGGMGWVGGGNRRLLWARARMALFLFSAALGKADMLSVGCKVSATACCPITCLPTVLSANQGDNRVVWFRNGGGAPPNITWTVTYLSTTQTFTRTVLAADVDSDGRMDVVSGAYMSSAKIMWYKNGGGSPNATFNVTWTASEIATGVLGLQYLHAADLDGDGRLDVLSANNNPGRIGWY